MSLKKIAQNKHGDHLIALLGPLAHRIGSDDWIVYAKQAEFERLKAGKKTDASLITYSLLRPSLLQGFARTTVASACMTETTFFRLFAAQGVEMKPVSERLRADLRYAEHEHGERITIHYATHEAWSKRYRDKTTTDESGANARVLDRIKAAIITLFGTEPFVWMGNKDLHDSFFGQVGAQRLPNTPHGLNSFQGFHNVVVVSALNPPPAHFQFMEGKGVSGEELRTGCYRTAVYQAVMRCSIRNPADENPKRVVVMDRDTAEWLAALFPGAAVMPLPGLGAMPSKGKAGRPRQHADDAAKAKAYRDEQERKLLTQLDLINGTSLIQVQYPHFAQQVWSEMRESARHDISSKEGDYVTALPPTSQAATCGTVFLSTYDRLPFDHFEHEGDDAFIADLRALHERVIEKEFSGLFSPAHFDPAKAADTGRGLDNVTHLRGIWLDNDGGDLTHEVFADLFPYLRIVVWNTASSTAAAPRWRAFIPTTYAMSLDVLALIMAQIVKVLNRAGFWGKKQLEKRPGIKDRRCHGFDETKFNGASMFYLPCQAKDPADSFFLDYSEGDPKRGPLDLHAWIEHCILDLRPDLEPDPVVVPMQAPTPKARPIATDQGRVCAKLQALRDALAAQKEQSGAGRRAAMVEKAVQDWRGAPRGSGHMAFFTLGAALQRAGLTDNEIAEKLRDEAFYARSPAKRRAEIKDLLKSLNRRGTFGRVTR
ncbi:hypothetical protein FV219_00810 [Methylobacterium sp. WL122]|nr:hypothetical protein FV219_00810 [Methylobacterium sp. WL122]